MNNMFLTTVTVRNCGHFIFASRIMFHVKLQVNQFLYLDVMTKILKLTQMVFSLVIVECKYVSLIFVMLAIENVFFSSPLESSFPQMRFKQFFSCSNVCIHIQNTSFPWVCVFWLSERGPRQCRRAKRNPYYHKAAKDI